MHQHTWVGPQGGGHTWVPFPSPKTLNAIPWPTPRNKARASSSLGYPQLVSSCYPAVSMRSSQFSPASGLPWPLVLPHTLLPCTLGPCPCCAFNPTVPLCWGGHGLSPRVSPSLTLPFPGPLTSRRSFLCDPSLVCPALLWVFTLRLPQGKMQHLTPQIRTQQTDTRDVFHEHAVKTPVLAGRAGSSELC